MAERWRLPVVTSALARLSPEQLAGQRIVYAYAGLAPPASLPHPGARYSSMTRAGS